MTKEIIHKIVLKMGGTFVSSLETTVIMHEGPAYFCVVGSQEILESLKAGTPKAHKGIAASLKGPWRYISKEFIVDCHDSQTLLDPNKYLWSDPTYDERKSLRANKHTSNLLRRQQRPKDAPALKYRTVMAAYKRNRTLQSGIEKKKCTKEKMFERWVDFTQPILSSARIRYNRFRRQYIAERQAEIEVLRKELVASTLPVVLTAKEVQNKIPMSIFKLNQMASKQWAIQKLDLAERVQEGQDEVQDDGQPQPESNEPSVDSNEVVVTQL